MMTEMFSSGMVVSAAMLESCMHAVTLLAGACWCNIAPTYATRESVGLQRTRVGSRQQLRVIADRAVLHAA